MVSRTANRTKTNNALRHAYSSMLRTNGKPIAFHLILKGSRQGAQPLRLG